MFNGLVTTDESRGAAGLTCREGAVSVMAPMLPMWLWGCGGALIGAIAGSFLATLTIRWPAGRTLGGRSRCDGCNSAIGVAGLVPLFSYACLRGRCGRCGVRIDPRHVLIEAAAAAIGSVALLLQPGLDGAAGMVFGWLLLTLAVLDFDHFWLPDRLTGLLAALGLAGGLAGLSPALPDRMIGGVAGFGALAMIAAVYAALRGRAGLGQGDPKMLGAIGLWLGWQALPFVLLGASLAGLAVVAALTLTGRSVTRTHRLPLGALMAMAAWPIWCAAAVTHM